MVSWRSRITRFTFRFFGEGRAVRSAPMKGWFLDERRFFTRGQQGAVRRAAKKRRGERPRWLEWFLVELAFETGLRVSEMAELIHSDLCVDLKRPFVLVRRGKGGKARQVLVRREFVDAVAEFAAWKESTGETVHAEAPVFLSSTTGKAMTKRALQDAFNRVCQAAGIQGHSIHDARHTYASELYRASGGNLRLVQKQLGHARITTTQVYADVFDEDATRAVEKLYRNNSSA